MHIDDYYRENCDCFYMESTDYMDPLDLDT
jgi:hypothetical protein